MPIRRGDIYFVNLNPTIGHEQAGQITRDRLLGLMRNLPDGLSEIYLHPATGPFAGAAPGYRYREEFEALTAPEIVEASRDPSLRLGGFSDFLCAEPALRPGAPPAAMPHRGVMP